jgi:catechol 2,3-dioxygenase-like lactoylglutathione lyase family enzyme
MSDQTNAQITGVYTVGIPVTDQDRALEFYVETLGLEKRLDVPMEQFGGRWIEVAPLSAPITIALVPEREGVPSGVETGIRLITPDADRVHANLERRGVEVGEMLRWPQTPAMFEVRDQDGNRFEIVEQT